MHVSWALTRRSEQDAAQDGGQSPLRNGQTEARRSVPGRSAWRRLENGLLTGQPTEARHTRSPRPRPFAFNPCHTSLSAPSLDLQCLPGTRLPLFGHARGLAVLHSEDGRKFRADSIPFTCCFPIGLVSSIMPLSSKMPLFNESNSLINCIHPFYSLFRR